MSLTHWLFGKGKNKQGNLKYCWSDDNK